MNQTQRRERLIRMLLAEEPERYGGMAVPADEVGQRRLLRALMNVRPPRPIGADFIALQDEYLSAERERRDVVDGMGLPTLRVDPRLALWQGDITVLKVDAIVNAANSALRGCFCPLHACIDNIIHTRSGVQLRLTCDGIMNAQGHDEPTGRAKLTPAYNLPSRFVLHTVGPVIRGEVTDADRAALADCYRACLKLAAENGLRSVAFCCISTGEFRFPQRQAAEIAVGTVRDCLDRDAGIERVIFNVFKDDGLAVYRGLLGEDQC